MGLLGVKGTFGAILGVLGEQGYIRGMACECRYSGARRGIGGIRGIGGF